MFIIYNVLISIKHAGTLKKASTNISSPERVQLGIIPLCKDTLPHSDMHNFTNKCIPFMTSLYLSVKRYQAIQEKYIKPVK